MIKKFSNLARERTVDLSVITATLPGRQDSSLRNVYESLLRQEGNYLWEWLLQIDGSETIQEDFLSDPRVRLASNGKQMGVAATRNLALERSLGGAVCYLDDDDQLLPGAFKAFLSPLSRNRDLVWAGGQMIYEYAGARQLQFESILPEGRVDRGKIFDLWLGPNLRFPHPPSTIAARTDVVRALGGWPALPQGDDLGLLVALSEYGPGYLSEENVYIYLQHSSNSTASADFEKLESVSRNIIWNRAALGRRLPAV